MPALPHNFRVTAKSEKWRYLTQARNNVALRKARRVSHSICVVQF